MEFVSKFWWVTTLVCLCIFSQSGYSMKFLSENCTTARNVSSQTEFECEMTSDGDNIEEFSFEIQLMNDTQNFETISKTLDKNTGNGSWDCQDCELPSSQFKFDVRLYKYDRPDMTLRVVFPDGKFKDKGHDLAFCD
jgi:hypothetical protein